MKFDVLFVDWTALWPHMWVVSLFISPPVMKKTMSCWQPSGILGMSTQTVTMGSQSWCGESTGVRGGGGGRWDREDATTISTLLSKACSPTLWGGGGGDIREAAGTASVSQHAETGWLHPQGRAELTSCAARHTHTHEHKHKHKTYSLRKAK